MASPSIGGILALTATNSLIMPFAGYSWRLTSLYYALFTFGIALMWGVLAKDVPDGEKGVRIGIIEVFLSLTKIPNVRVILAGGFLSFAVIHGYTNWLPKILEVQGMSPSTAGTASALPLMAGMPAILALPSLIPVRFRGRAIGLLALSAGASMLLMVNATGAALFAGLALFGFSGSAIPPLLILTLMETPEVGHRFMGSAGGIFFCISDFGGFVGPSIMGALVDWKGTFLPGTLFQAMLCLLIFGITFLLKGRGKE
jgi:NNP family nitrate/nitrite transporter-like MFS transporter